MATKIDAPLTPQLITKAIRLSDSYVEAVSLEQLPNVLLEQMRKEDAHATLQNTTIELDVERDFYSNCSCYGRINLMTRRKETAQEVANRLKSAELLKEVKRRADAEKRKERQEAERATYERLKAKFEKPTKRSKP